MEGEQGSRTPSVSVSLPRKGSIRKSREPGDLEQLRRITYDRTSERKPNGIKKIKRREGQDRDASHSAVAIEGIRMELKRTNDIMDSLRNENVNAAEMERTYMALR